jgi:hypothetical protein
MATGEGMFESTSIDKDKSHFGGSKEASDDHKALASGIAGGGQGQIGQGVSRMGGAGNDAAALGNLGGDIYRRGRDQQIRTSNAAEGYGNQLGAFRSNASDIGQAMGRQMLSEGRQQALSLASAGRGGNTAAAMREGLSANAQAAGQAAMAGQVAAGQQQLAADQMRMQALGQAAGIQQGLAGMGLATAEQGLGLQQFDAATNAQIGQQLAALGAGREATGLQTLTATGALESQLATQIALEQARLDEERKKRGAALVGAGIESIGGLLGSVGGM